MKQSTSLFIRVGTPPTRPHVTLPPISFPDRLSEMLSDIDLSATLERMEAEMDGVDGPRAYAPSTPDDFHHD